MPCTANLRLKEHPQFHLKAAVVKMINSLNQDIAFNLAMFGRAIDVYKQHMARATDDNKRELNVFPSLIMASYDVTTKGNLLKNYKPRIISINRTGSSQADPCRWLRADGRNRRNQNPWQ